MGQDVTEVEAWEKWCPMTRAEAAVTGQQQCMGSKCMAWQWKEDRTPGAFTPATGGIELATTGISTTHGHCGLAR